MSSPLTSPYVAIQLHSDCSSAAADLICLGLTRSWSDGGSGLLVAAQPPNDAVSSTVLHVSATRHHLLRIARIIHVKKKDATGLIRLVSAEDADQFEDLGRAGPLSLSDIQRCLQHALHRLHFPQDTLELPGHPGLSFHPSFPVLATYQQHGLVTVLPLHHLEDLDKLEKIWRTCLLDGPIDDIRAYFGENVALYFSFTQIYTKFLIVLAVIGFLHYVLEKVLVVSIYDNLVFSLLNLVAVGIFLEVWKRRGNEHAFNWGTLGKLRHKPHRPQYWGKWTINNKTGKEELHYPANKTKQKLFLVSLPLTILCLVVAFLVMLTYFYVEQASANFFSNSNSSLISTTGLQVPTIIYCLVILISNYKYTQLARHLTTWENHRTQEQHDNHLAYKLIIFQFVNTFLALFYVGLYLGDLNALRFQLLTTFLIQQIIHQNYKVFSPLLDKPLPHKLIEKVNKKLGMKKNVSEPVFCRLLSVDYLPDDDPRINDVNNNLLASTVHSPQNDFMEQWLQFGYVILFTNVFPLGPFLALVNNLLELAADRYKFCRLTRKPWAYAQRDIGAWLTAFQLTSVLAVSSNCWLLAISLKDTAGQGWQTLHWAALFVAIEHIFFVIFAIIDKLIPDVPSHVKIALEQMAARKLE